MNDNIDKGRVQKSLSSILKSDSEILWEKKGKSEAGEKHVSGHKRAKMRDIESVCQSEITNTNHTKLRASKKTRDRFQCRDEETTQGTQVPKTLDLDALPTVKAGKDTFSVARKSLNSNPKLLDLNSEVFPSQTSTSDWLEHVKNVEDDRIMREDDGTGLDLNAEDVSTAAVLEPTTACKNHDRFKSRDVSECASSVYPLEQKDPLMLWKEMKQNGFLSSSHGHGGIPVPKQRGRKSKNDMLKKKMELAKKEQVDRFAKIAAPSGLLNGLNPGIINHVRNRKQVQSIIEALVKSENGENRKQSAAHMNNATLVNNTSKDPENRNVSEIGGHSYVHGHGPSITSGSRQTKGYPMTMIGSLVLEGQGGDGDKTILERLRSKTSGLSTLTSEEDSLALRLSSSSKVSENVYPFSNEESDTYTCVQSLSVKAATVASNWLELLHQDIKGRLSALRRSKKRVHAVITTELPFLISKEFSTNKENDTLSLKNSADGLSHSASGILHRARWTALFERMDSALSEEEKQLETWLNHVKEMQLLCDQGLQRVPYGFQQQGGPEKDSSALEMNSSARELAIGAAAASIYSTCNFLLSDNLAGFSP